MLSLISQSESYCCEHHAQLFSHHKDVNYIFKSQLNSFLWRESCSGKFKRLISSMFAFDLKSNRALDQISEKPFLCFCRFCLMGNQNYAFWITNTKCKGMSACFRVGVGVWVWERETWRVCVCMRERRVSEESSNAHIWILMYRNLHAAGFMSRGCCKYS